MTNEAAAFVISSIDHYCLRPGSTTLVKRSGMGWCELLLNEEDNLTMSNFLSVIFSVPINLVKDDVKNI